MVEIICSGFGGQGVLVAGMILADAGMEEGKHVTWYPSYGSEMRGGTANCNIKMDDKEISSPYCHDIDILYTLNDAAIDKFESQIKPGGILLVNSSLVRPERKFRHDVTVIKVPASDSALSYASHHFDVAYMRGAVDHFFAKKGKNNPKNGVCFDRGVEAAKKQME